MAGLAPQSDSTWPGRLAAAQSGAFIQMVVRELSSSASPYSVYQRAGRRPRRAAARNEPCSLPKPMTFRRGIVSTSYPPTTPGSGTSGPVFLLGETPMAAVHAARFPLSTPGASKYPPWDLDDAVAARIARSARAITGLPRLGCRLRPRGRIGIDGNGSGHAVLTTASCLLSGNRRLPGAATAQHRGHAGAPVSSGSERECVALAR